jgi:16S rRNA (adenine1518-N6/adenine1519-N6)-dimethyltransferase
MGFGTSEFKKPKRSLGQNFFVNENLARSLTNNVFETNPKTVIEIGPGKGFFTKILLEKDVDVMAIEKDSSLVEGLKILYPNLKIFNEDIFSKNLPPLFKKTKDTVCFGSLPYNISKKIIAYLAENSDIKYFYFIVQKEVAEKYASRGKTSMLSLATSIFFDCKILYHIKPENFSPRPNVQSSFIKFERNENVKKIENVEKFLQYLHLVFRQPRKKIKNNIKQNIKDSKLLDKRAEDLNLEEHLKLWRSLVV